jgi:hypothetical protein
LPSRHFTEAAAVATNAIKQGMVINAAKVCFTLRQQTRNLCIAST